LLREPLFLNGHTFQRHRTCEESGRFRYLADFFRTYQPLVRNYLAKSGLSATDAEDLAQDTMLEVSSRIKTFEYDRKKGTFKAWLFRLTRWRVANYFKSSDVAKLAITFPLPDHHQQGTTTETALLTCDP
jgi:RNA polymerase sigma factor (sigma-70 family)